MHVPMPFNLPRHMQFACEQVFERELQHFMRKTFTVANHSERTEGVEEEGEPLCLLDLIPAPSCNFTKGMDFLEWAQKTLRTLHFLLGRLLRLSSCGGGKQTLGVAAEQEEELMESRASRIWYAQYMKLSHAEAYRTPLRVQIEHYILYFPTLVGDHVSCFPNLCFEDKLELMCSLNFSACKIFLSPFWNPKAVPECPDLTPKAMVRFHASWQQPLYRKVMSKADVGSFSIRILDAYQKPIARLMDHYHYYELLLSTSFPI